LAHSLCNQRWTKDAELEGGTFMKFMATWSTPQDKWLPVLKKWTSMSPQERANAGDNVKIIGRWHDTTERTGVAIFESNDLMAVQRYIGQWNPHMEIDLTPWSMTRKRRLLVGRYSLTIIPDLEELPRASPISVIWLNS
jgi:hypothetical protein